MNFRRARQPRQFASMLLTAAAAMLLGSAIVIAQYRVNTQIYGNPGPSVKYGYGPGYAQYPTSQLLPSENRNLVYRSGATPSEIRMGRAAVGPLPSQGFQAYVPAPGPRYTVGSVGTSLNYVDTRSGAVSPSAYPSARYPVAPMSGSVRYAPLPSVGTFQVKSAAIPPVQITGSSINAFVPSAEIGSIRYSP